MAEAAQVIGEATCYDSLVAALRKRKSELGPADVIVDELAGLAAGHTGKILGGKRVPARRRGGT